MSQATTWGVQSAGPATMAQYAVRDNAALDALLSAHRGASRPTYAVASTIWVKAGTAPVTDAEIYYFDGTNDILIATINESTNAITFAGLGTAAVEDVATGGSGDLLRSDGSAAQLTNFPLPTNHISGLTLSNNATDADHDLDIAAGKCRSLADDANITIAAITKRIDAAWAVGTGEGGLDTGTVANNTAYAVHAIRRSDTGVSDVLISASFSAPTMPADYDQRRLIGFVRTDGSANIVAFTQVGDYFRYRVRPNAEVSDNTLTTDTFETATLIVPPSSLVHINVELNNTGATDSTSHRYVIRPNGADDAPTSGEYFQRLQSAANGDIIATTGTVLVDGSSQIQYAATFASGTPQMIIGVHGVTMIQRSEP